MQVHCTKSPNAATQSFILSNGPSDKQRAVRQEKELIGVLMICSKYLYGSLFFISETRSFWRLRAVQVRVEDIKAIETHLRVSNSAISHMTISQVRIHSNTSWGRRKVVSVIAAGSLIPIIRAVARRWRWTGRLLFLGPTTSSRHDRRLTFNTLYCSLSSQRIFLLALHFDSVSFLCLYQRTSLPPKNRKRSFNKGTSSPSLCSSLFLSCTNLHPCHNHQHPKSTIKERIIQGSSLRSSVARFPYIS